MYKNIALLALLLPFSGYAITKQERAQKRARMTQIVQEVQAIEREMKDLNEIIKHNLWVAFIYGDSIRKSIDEACHATDELNKEYKQLQQEIS